MFIPVEIWFRAFMMTLVVEAPIVAVALRRWEPSLPRLLVLVACANLASHPIVWFVLTQVLLLGTPEYLSLAEAWAVACESAVYWVALRGLPMRRAVAVSLAANAASFVVGQVAAHFWPALFW